MSAYDLRHLVPHLAAAGGAADLHRLLRHETTRPDGGADNFWYAAKSAAADTDGFMRDVALAQRTTDARPGEEGAPALGLELRYALVAASIRSLAGALPAQLLVALVRRVIWPLRDALAQARALPRPEERVVALTGLADAFSGSEQRRVLEEAVEAAGAIADPRTRRDVLLEFAAEWARRGLVEETLAVARAIPGPDGAGVVSQVVAAVADAGEAEAALDAALAIPAAGWRYDALTSVARRSSGLLRASALEAALAAAVEAKHRSVADFLFEFADCLGDELSGHAIRVARALDGDERVRALAALADAGPGGGTAQRVNRIRAAAAQLGFRDRVLALADLATRLRGRDQRRVVDEALGAFGDGIGHQDTYSELARRWARAGLPEPALAAAEHAYYAAVPGVLATVAPLLSEPLFARALELARGGQVASDRHRRVAALALNSAEARKGPLVEEAVAGSLEHADLKTLVTLLPHLPTDRAAVALRSALDEVAATKSSARDRIDAIATLALHLSGSLLADAFAQVQALDAEKERRRGLAALAPRLTDGQLREALEATPADDEPARVFAAAELLAQLAAAGRRDEALARGLALRQRAGAAWLAPVRSSYRESHEQLSGRRLAARSFPERWKVVAGLTVIAPYAPSSMLTDAVTAALDAGDEVGAEALTRVAPYLDEPQLRRALAAAARRGGDGSGLTRAVPALAAALAAAGHGTEALAAARDTTPPRLRADALARVANRLPERERMMVLHDAVDGLGADARTAFLEQVAPYLPHALLESAAASVRQVVSEADEAGAAELAPLLGHLAQHQLHRLLDTTQAILDEEALWRALSSVPEAAIEHEPISRPPGRAAMAAVLGAANVVRRAHALATSATGTPAEAGGTAGAGALLRSWLRAAAQAEPHRPRAAMLELVAPLFVALDPVEVQPLWGETLARLSLRSRADLLSDIAALAPAIAALGGGQAVSEVLSAIDDTGRWWP